MGDSKTGSLRRFCFIRRSIWRLRRWFCARKIMNGKNVSEIGDWFFLLLEMRMVKEVWGGGEGEVV